jgi:dihydrofolate reductase
VKYGQVTRKGDRMRKLKLQMQVSVNGMIGTKTQKGPGSFNWDDEIRQYSISNTANVDCILLGRRTADGFIPYWRSVAANPKDADFELGKLITSIPKVIFSRTLRKSEWPNATVATDELADSVNQLKKQTGTCDSPKFCPAAKSTACTLSSARQFAMTVFHVPLLPTVVRTTGSLLSFPSHVALGELGTPAATHRTKTQAPQTEGQLYRLQLCGSAIAGPSVEDQAS